LKPLRANEVKFGQLFTSSTHVGDFRLSSLPGREHAHSKQNKNMYKHGFKKKKISSEGCAPVFEDSKNKRSIKGQFMLTDTNVCLSSTCLLHPKKISCHYED
jgi:hypothetical protein